ncbi:pentatricopeptide repeat-containing protein At4g02750 [Selaginella moellendorffii]|nr:pentatricopeptide repeat-containing protein At4g02750 [Selaginella moellendorffii]|eukprot:XP_002980129.2 pentatricopeptide repeat-containing protein At4g02750 [Selaginella moellendorffii]
MVTSSSSRALDREACLQLIRSSRTVAMVEEAHSKARHLLPLDVFVSNMLVQRYGRCGSVEHARRVFDSIPEKNFFSWVSLLGAYAANGRLDEAASVFNGMPEWNSVACTAMLVGYAQNGQLEKARGVFWSMKQRDLASWNAFLAVLVNERQDHRLLEARKLFETMPARDVVTWTTLLGAYAQRNHLFNTKDLFDSMPVRDLISCTAMLGAYEDSGDLRNASFVFKSMEERDIISCSALLAVYAQEGHLEQALKHYHSMPELNVISCTTMITVYSKNRLVNQAQQLFDSMPEHNLVSRTSMLCVFTLNDRLEEAKHEFDKMPEWNSVAITALISLYARSGYSLSFLESSGVALDTMASTALLIGYAQDGHLEAAKSVFDSIPACDAVVRTSMLSSYALLGNVRGGERVFLSAPEQDDFVLWNAMLAAYAQNGHSTQVLELFFTMVLLGLKVPPDGASFLSILLACSHLGRVQTGWSCFVSMAMDYGLQPLKQHYNCFVDLLCRTGFLAEARELIQIMPFDADGVEWRSYLRSSVEAGNTVVENLDVCKRDSPGAYVLLANLHKNRQGGMAFAWKKGRSSLPD